MQSIGPNPAGEQTHPHFLGDNLGCDHLEAVAGIARNGRHAGTDNVACRGLAPMAVDLRRRIVVDVRAYSALLVEDTGKIGDGIERPPREVAFHDRVLSLM